MKKLILFTLSVFASVMSFAQTNLQTQYDFGQGHLIATLEMFKADNWGSTFFFADYNMTNHDDRQLGVHGATGSYMEISRSLNFWQDTKLAPVSAHVEANFGVLIPTNLLFGADYALHSADFSKTLTLSLLAKTHRYYNTGAQFTAVWGLNNLLGVDGLNFSGFLDVWNQNETVVMMSQPQLWYNVGKLFSCENLNIGGEIEFTNNFYGKGFKMYPRLGTKWIF